MESDGQIAIGKDLHTPAGFWVRMCAAGIDAVIVGAGFALIVALGEAVGLSAGETWLVQVGAFLIYGVAFAALLSGTPGKLLLRIRIVGIQGEKIGPVRAALRYLAVVLSIYLLFLGVVMIALDKRKRGLHDYIANTLVIKAH